MAQQLNKTDIAQNFTIEAWHVSQSVDAFTGQAAYDITISGSLILTGSVNSQNGYTGSLYGNAFSATSASSALIANTASLANLVKPTNTVTNFAYTIPYLTGTGSSAGVAYSGTGPRYNPISESVEATNFTGTASLATTASYALLAEDVQETFTNNHMINYFQGTIYTKFDNVNASPGTNYDLFSSSLARITGTRTLTPGFINAAIAGDYKSKILKFRIVGKFDSTSGTDLTSYVQLGSSILNSTRQTVSLQTNQNHPFEILYDLTFGPIGINGCGSIRYCDNQQDLKAIALADPFTADPYNLNMVGDIQFIISGSSNTVLTGSLAYIEFMN